MKKYSRIAVIIVMSLNATLAEAGYDLPAAGPKKGQISDGEPLGRPERDNPDFDPRRPAGPLNPPKLPADPVDPTAKQKIADALEAKFTTEAKCQLGEDAWNALNQAGKDAAFEQAVIDLYNTNYAPKTWATDLNAAQQMLIIATLKGNAKTKAEMERAAQKKLGETAWAALNQGQKDALLNARRDATIIEMIGQAAWDALSPAEKTAKRAALADDKIKAARANVALALDVIKCINAAVADCVRKTWEKGRLCIDFKSKGASGSILPNCAGKAAGCDPDNNPINIAFASFPCKAIDKIYDPEFYLLLTTIYHEGVHSLQAFGAKAGRSAPARLYETSTNELETHGAENAFIALLCPPLDVAIAGGAPADGGNPAVKKFTDCLNLLAVADRKAAASALKTKLQEIKANNIAALACYQDYINIINDLLDGPPPTQQQAVDQIKALRWIAARIKGRLLIAGGGGNVVQQTDYDPVTAAPIDMSFTVSPVDEITEMFGALNDSVLLVIGNDNTFGDGVLLAFTDQDGDGFFDPATGQELLRDFQLHGSMAVVPDPAGVDFLGVNLVSGEVFHLTQDEFNFVSQPNLLPDIANNVGFMNIQNEFFQRVVASDDGQTLFALPGVVVGPDPVLVPDTPIAISDFSPTFGFQPLPQQEVFEQMDLPPVFVEASTLPVLSTTSTLNQLTTELLVAGRPGASLQIEIVLPLQPPLLLPGFLLAADGRAMVPLPVQLDPGSFVRLLEPAVGMEFPDYIARDAEPRVLNPVATPGGFSFDLLGIPGMEFQPMFSPNLAIPFEPIGDSMTGEEGPVTTEEFTDIPPDHGFFTAIPTG